MYLNIYKMCVIITLSYLFGVDIVEETRTISLLDRTFHLSENNTNIKQECLAGLTTFVSMTYILFVNPSVLGVAGMDKGVVFTATALSAIIGCFLMGLLANYPIAIAPGLGDNAFFTYSVVLAIGIPLAYNISYGIAFGFLTYPILMVAAGRRKEVNAVMWSMFFVFIVLLYILNILPK